MPRLPFPLQAPLNRSADPYEEGPTDGDYTNPTFDVRYFHRIRSVVGVWLLLASLIGTPTNALVLRCAYQICRSNKSILLYQYFVLSMTMADLIFVSLVAPSLFGQFYFRVKYERPWCTGMYVLSHCATVSSSLSLLCLNLDKFIAIWRPLHHSSIVTRRRVISAVIVCWIFGASWSTFFVFGPALKFNPNSCALNVASFEYYLVFTLGFFVLPTTVAAVLGAFIAAIAYQNDQQQIDLRFEENPTNSTGGGGGGSIIAYGRRNTALSARTSVGSRGSQAGSTSNTSNTASSRARTLTFVFATTAWSSLTYLPYRIMYPIYISGRFEPWQLPVGFAFFSLMCANPVGNPIITILTQRRYRILLSKMWSTSCPRRFVVRASELLVMGGLDGRRGGGVGGVNGAVGGSRGKRNRGAAAGVPEVSTWNGASCSLVTVGKSAPDLESGS